jgi:flagellar M-ring protein FliF
MPFWRQSDTQETLRQLAWPLGLALVALIVVFGAIRPVLKQAAPKEPAKLVDAMVDDAQELPALTDGSTADGVNGGAPALAGPAVDPLQKRIDEAKRLAKENPAAVANIVRGWVNREAA